MSFELINPYQTFWDSTGKVRAGGKVTIFDNKTTTKASIFSDEALTVAQTNPYTLNANGQIIGDLKYQGLKTLQVSNSDGSDIRTTDNVVTIGLQTKTENLSNVTGTNTITATGTPTITALVDKTVFNFIAVAATTGPVSLQVDATGAKSVLKHHDKPITFGDWGANQALSVIYNGTDDVFELKTPTLSPQIQPITATVAASALTLGLNPTSLYFRKTDLTDGRPIIGSTGALSLVVPSGATLGTTDAIESRITLIAIFNATIFELVCINASTTSLDETGLITTVAIDATADSADVFYSTTARTLVPYRVVGFLDSTQATAGTWDTAPTLVQGVGGNAINTTLNTKVLEIGDWNMDGNSNVNVAHGLTLANIRSISVLIREDANTVYYMFPAPLSAAVDVEDIEVTATNVTLKRGGSGFFDNTGFDSTSFNRGWITIQYVP